MVRVSVFNDALRSMYNAEKRGKRQVMVRPSSKVIIKFLWFFFVDDLTGFEINLFKFGYIVLTTSAGVHGIMNHEEARRKNVGGKVLGLFY